MKTYDLTVIGAGTGGGMVAQGALQWGLRVLLIESSDLLGGMGYINIVYRPMR